MGIFSIEPGLAIWTWITFGVLLFLLSKFVFPTLLQNIKDRENAISDSITNAEEIKKRLSDIELEYKNAIDKSRKEADKILMATRQEAEELKKDLFEKAELEASKILADAKVTIEEERRAAFDSIKKEIVELVCDGSEKLIGNSFVGKKERAWTKELIETL